MSLVELAVAVTEAETSPGRLLRLAELRQAVDAAMVAALGQVDPGHWLAARSEIHPVEAKALAGLARSLPDMPAAAEALEAGRIGTEGEAARQRQRHRGVRRRRGRTG